MSAWVQYTDDNGNCYYFNAETNETSWDPPPVEMSAENSGWIETADESGNIYYYNSATNETSWDKPSTWKDPIESVQDSVQQVQISSSRSRTRTKSNADEQPEPCYWTALTVEGTGDVYYYNSKTTETQWDMPEELKKQATGSQGSTVTDQPPADSRTNNLKKRSDSIKSTDSPGAARSSSIIRRTSTSSTGVSRDDGNSSSGIPTRHPSIKLSSSQIPSTTPTTTVRKSATRNASINQGNSSSTGGTTSVSANPASGPGTAAATQDTNKKPFRPLSGVGNPAMKLTSEENKMEDNIAKDLSSEELGRRRTASSESVHVQDSTMPQGNGPKSPQLDASLLLQHPDTAIAEMTKLVTGYSLEQYAEANFNFERRGLYQNKSTAEKLLSWKPELIKSSLCILDAELNEEAIECFRNVTGFMGDRKTKKDASDHVAALLSSLISSPAALHIEVLCQICKQLRGNPSFESKERGWHLLLLCLSSVPVAAAFLPYFISFLTTFESAKVTAPTISKLAGLAMIASIKGLGLPVRKELPLQLEIESITAESESDIVIRVYFVDEHYTMLRVDSWTTVSDVEKKLCQKLGLGSNWARSFGLYQTISSSDDYRTLEENERVLDILSYWERLAIEENSGSHRGNANATAATSHGNNNNAIINSALGTAHYEPRLVFKIKYFLLGLTSPIDSTATANIAALDMLYIQTYHDVLSAHYPCSIHDYLVLGALRLQELHGDFPLSVAMSGIFDDKLLELSPRAAAIASSNTTTNNNDFAALKSSSSPSIASAAHFARREALGIEFAVVEYATVAECEAVLRICLRDSTDIGDILPLDALSSHLDDTDTSPSAPIFNRHRIIKTLCSLYEKCMGMSRMEARTAYISFAQSWKLYGASYFLAEASEDHNSPFEIILAVTPQALLVVDPETRCLLQEFSYKYIVSWGHSYNSFVLVSSVGNGGLQVDQKKYFKTEQGKEINDYINAYVKQ